MVVQAQLASVSSTFCRPVARHLRRYCIPPSHDAWHCWQATMCASSWAASSSSSNAVPSRSTVPSKDTASGIPVSTLAVSPLEIARMPPLRFSGRITVISVPEDEARAENLFVGATLLGFDSESRPSTAIQPKNRTAVIQVASEHAVCIWRIAELGGITPLLKRLLEDPSKHKAAQGAAQEVDALREEFGLGPQSFIDLHHIALHLKTTPRSLQGLVALFLKKRLGKEQRLTNWEQSPLTQAQIEYAALDAWASREVLLAIRRLYGVQMLDCERLLGAAAGPPKSAPELSRYGEQMAMLSSSPLTATRAKAGASQPSVQEQTAVYEAHQTLAALCIERGYVLRFDGFEAASGGYRCVFRVEYRHKGQSVAEAFRSKRPHSSIRSAQNDAATEALLRLQSLPSE